MAKLVLFNKPFQVLSQFRDESGRTTLKQYFDDASLRVAGRLDYDSEGLLLLTDDGKLAQQISNPAHKMWKTYWVQVEGEADLASLQTLRDGIQLSDGPTRAAKVRIMEPSPGLWHRQPPIRERKNIPTQWLEIKIREGRNRQVRRMTAAVGLPTLRLVRVAVGGWRLTDLQPGQQHTLEINMPKNTSRPSPLRRPRRGI